MKKSVNDPRIEITALFASYNKTLEKYFFFLIFTIYKMIFIKYNVTFFSLLKM